LNFKKGERKMKYFTIPSDFKKETIDAYVELNKKYRDSRIIETYGNVTIGENLGSGRVIQGLPEVDLLDLQEYVKYSRAKGIEFSYTMNNPYLQNTEFTEEGAKRILGVLDGLYNIGVRSITVSMPSLISLIKFSKYDFKIKISTICHITNVNKAVSFARMGMERMVLDESIHRDFKTLRRIREVVGDKCEIIVNTMCHRNCIYRAFHYNQTGGDSVGKSNEVAVNFFEHNCMLQRYDGVHGLLRLAWVRPEDLKYYSGIGINYFKLQGRQHVINGDHLRAVESYMKESFDGNLMDLLDMFNTRYSFKVHLDNKKLEGFLRPYVEKENFCQMDCQKCGYCKSFAKKCIDAEKAKEVIASAEAFYKDFDQFKRLVQSVDEQQERKIKENEMNTQFELG
jgi:collagenase-like PrtC family protease